MLRVLNDQAVYFLHLIPVLLYYRCTTYPIVVLVTFFVIIYLMTIFSTKLGDLDGRGPGLFTIASPFLREPSTYIAQYKSV